jgi:hypothetical protein
MYLPIDEWNGVPVFSSDCIEIYGEPNLYGYEDYYVVESTLTAKPFFYDFNTSAIGNSRPIHRYKRLERFTFTLGYLVGLKGSIPDKVLDACLNVSKNPKTIWNDIKQILKHHKWNIYYNRIALIIDHLGLKITNNMTNAIFYKVINEFKQMESLFDQGKKQEWNRRYFLNLKFVALKLLEKHKVTFNINIPMIKTKRKLVVLNALWEDLL